MAKQNQDLSQKRFQLGSAKPANAGDSELCAQCEAMLSEALDNVLSEEEQAQFDLHLASCTTCSQMLADARRGVAWLEMLRTPRPEPPAALLERILTQTSGIPALTEPGSLVAVGDIATAEGLPAPRTANILPFPSRVAAKFNLRTLGHAMLQPRLAMTAAMAFFSVGLTFNLTGTQLNQIHASDLKPSSIRRTFYQANAHVVRYVDNLRAVYELESRVHDLQREDDSDATPPLPMPSNDQKPADAPETKTTQPAPKQARPHASSGTSGRQGSLEPLSNPSFRLANYAVSPSRSLRISALGTSSALQEGDLL